MFRNKTLRSIPCVAHFDVEDCMQTHQTVMKTIRRGNSPRISERTCEGDGDTGSDPQDFKQPGRGKSLRKKWSKLKKYLNGNSGSHSGADQDCDFNHGSFPATNTFSGGRAIDEPSCETSTKNLDVSITKEKMLNDRTAKYKQTSMIYERNSENLIDIGSQKLPEQDSVENVERWLRVYHQDPNNKMRKHQKCNHSKSVEVYKNDFFKPVCHRHMHVTHRQKRFTHKSAEESFSSSSIPIVDLSQLNTLQKLTSRESNQHQPFNEDSLNALNPSLAHFMAELIDSLEKLQRSNNAEVLPLCPSANASTIKNSAKLGRSLSDSSLNQNRFTGDRSIDSAAQIFSTSTPREKAERHNKVFDKKLQADTRRGCDSYPKILTDIFNVGPSVTASVSREALKIQVDSKELTYNFKENPKQLMEGMRDIHRTSVTAQENLFNIYEFVVNIQSSIIKDLYCKLDTLERQGACTSTTHLGLNETN